MKKKMENCVYCWFGVAVCEFIVLTGARMCKCMWTLELFHREIDDNNMKWCQQQQHIPMEHSHQRAIFAAARKIKQKKDAFFFAVAFNLDSLSAKMTRFCWNLYLFSRLFCIFVSRSLENATFIWICWYVCESFQIFRSHRFATTSPERMKSTWIVAFFHFVHTVLLKLHFFPLCAAICN